MIAMLFGINQTYSVANAQEESKHIIVEVGSQKFDAILTNEEAAKEFYGKLPMTLNMSELNGNEKYYYMNQSIPTNNQVGGKIKTGDFRLYDGDCLVWFYKPFTTSYRYTN